MFFLSRPFSQLQKRNPALVSAALYCVCFLPPKKHPSQVASPNTPPAVDIETKKWSMSTCFLSKQRRTWPRYRELVCPPGFRLGSPTKNIINTIVLVVIVTGQGDNPIYIYIPNIKCNEVENIILGSHISSLYICHEKI